MSKSIFTKRLLAYYNRRLFITLRTHLPFLYVSNNPLQWFYRPFVDLRREALVIHFKCIRVAGEELTSLGATLSVQLFVEKAVNNTYCFAYRVGFYFVNMRYNHIFASVGCMSGSRQGKANETLRIPAGYKSQEIGGLPKKAGRWWPDCYAALYECIFKSGVLLGQNIFCQTARFLNNLFC